MRYSASSSACTVGATANATEEPSASEASTREPAPSAQAALCTASRAPGWSSIAGGRSHTGVCLAMEDSDGSGVFAFAVTQSVSQSVISRSRPALTPPPARSPAPQQDTSFTVRYAKLKALREPAPQQPGTHSGRYAAVVYTRHGHGISSCQEAVRTQDLRSQAGDRSADVTPLVRRESRRRGHD